MVDHYEPGHPPAPVRVGEDEVDVLVDGLAVALIDHVSDPSLGVAAVAALQEIFGPTRRRSPDEQEKDSEGEGGCGSEGMAASTDVAPVLDRHVNSLL